MSASHVPDDAKTRPSPFGEGLRRRRVAGQEWHVRPELAAELLGPRGLRLEEWLAAGVAAVVKHGPHRTVYRLSLPSGTYYLKHYRLAGPRAWLQNNLRPCRAYREAAASARVRAAGIETADLAAAGRRVTGPFSRDSYVLSREVPGVVPLDECLGEQGASSPRATAERRALRRNLIERLAALTASLHRRGLFHADYHAGNVLVRADGDAVRLWLIDLHPLRPARMTAKRRWAMLGMLAASLSPHATRSDRRRFLKAYAAAFG
ncbi:MAG TPA: lipopolysaccharide kinase InaA family protein, partial [Planctomycetaceae bacterium]